MKGTHRNKIKSIMDGDYASMVTDTVSSRTNGLFLGGLGGLVLGGLFGQNALKTAVIGAIVGFIITSYKS